MQPLQLEPHLCLPMSQGRMWKGGVGSMVWGRNQMGPGMTSFPPGGGLSCCMAFLSRGILETVVWRAEEYRDMFYRIHRLTDTYSI